MLQYGFILWMRTVLNFLLTASLLNSLYRLVVNKSFNYNLIAYKHWKFKWLSS